MSTEVTFQEGFNPFDDSVESAQTQPETEPQNQPEVAPEVTPEVTLEQAPEKQEPQVDYNAFVKENFGFDSVDVAKEEFEKLRTQQPEIVFENDLSKTLYEAIKAGKEDDVFNIIQQKKQIDSLLSVEVTKENALEIVKKSYELKYPDLTKEEIDLLSTDNYRFPEKPIKGEFEEDDEYAVKLNAWNAEVDRVNRKIVIDAKLARPELQKSSQEIKLPEIGNNAQNPDPKELEGLMEARKSYEQTLNKEYVEFNGFSVGVKDGEVEIPVTFNVSDEEKQSLKERLSDFNAEEYLYKRWFSEDGKPQIKQMMSDIYLLENQSKILQKVGNEAASQRMLQQIKQSGQINVGTQPQRTINQSEASIMDSLADWAFSS